MNEELTKAQIALVQAKTREREEKLIPVKVAHNTTIMMKRSATTQEIQAKIKQYKNRPL